MDEYNRVVSTQVEALKVSEDMRLVLQDAFGPNGRAVMFQNSNGHLTITRSAGEILKSVFSQNSHTPVCNLFLKFISEIQDEIGDGVKYFVLIVNSLLKDLKLLSNPVVVKKMQNLQVILSNAINHPENDSDCCVRQVIYTFFSTRFTSIVANFLSKLTFEFVSTLSFFSLNQVLKYFPMCCVTFSSLPLSESVIKEGFLFKGIVCNSFINTSKCIVKVYLYSEDETPDDGEIESGVTDLILSIWEGVLVLLITNVALPDRVMFFINLRNIITVQNVDFIETRFLFEYLMKHSQDFITEFKVQDNYVWVNLPGVCQFILNAPNKDFVLQYKNSIEDCLKLISFTSSKSKLTCKAGQFEKKFTLHINSCSGNSVLPPVNCRRQLDCFLKMKSELICDRIVKESNMEKTKEIDMVEENCNTFLLRMCSVICSEISEPVILTALCKAMWEVSVKLLDDKNDGIEFVIVKLAILNKAISAVVLLSQADGMLKVGKKSKIISSIVRY